MRGVSGIMHFHEGRGTIAARGYGAEPQEPTLFTSLASKNPCLAQLATETFVIWCMIYGAQLHLNYRLQSTSFHIWENIREKGYIK